MNPDLKDLRVAVVPTETGNGIDQSSTVQEIIDCPETRWFSVPDYFKAQNDEELDLLHWSFLIDYSKLEDCTGINTDGIDMFNKEANIARIQDIIVQCGETTTSELGLESSPCIYSNNGNVVELVEGFYRDCVTSCVYDDEVLIEQNDYFYEELSEEIIKEILHIMIDYKENKESEN